MKICKKNLQKTHGRNDFMTEMQIVLLFLGNKFLTRSKTIFVRFEETENIVVYGSNFTSCDKTHFYIHSDVILYILYFYIKYIFYIFIFLIFIETVYFC